MSKYSGTPFTVAAPIQDVYDRVARVEGYQQMLDSKLADASEELRQKVEETLQGIRFQDGKIILTAPGVGEVAMVPGQNVPPTHVELSAEGAPVPIIMALDLQDLGAEGTSLTPSIDVELPAMLKPFLGPKLQEAARTMGLTFEHLLS